LSHVRWQRSDSVRSGEDRGSQESCRRQLRVGFNGEQTGVQPYSPAYRASDDRPNGNGPVQEGMCFWMPTSSAQVVLTHGEGCNQVRQPYGPPHCSERGVRLVESPLATRVAPHAQKPIEALPSLQPGFVGGPVVVAATPLIWIQDLVLGGACHVPQLQHGLKYSLGLSLRLNPRRRLKRNRGIDR
jgi:hypothetical protein